MNKTYIVVPATGGITLAKKILYLIKGLFLSPIYWIIAHQFNMPGLNFYKECVNLGFLLLFKRKSLPYNSIYNLFFFPMDSTRYFEFDFVWSNINKSKVIKYLDISSPRIIPLLFLKNHPGVVAELVNPDKKDFAYTAKFLEDLHLKNRCNLHCLLIEDAPYKEESFDLITCISVLEHIPESQNAILKIWNLLSSGGTLIITLPCMAEATIQYISESEYGLFKPGTDGFTFWQQYYDTLLLEERIYKVTGSPVQINVYGEKKPGSFARNAEQKRLGGTYPFWREPYMMGKEYDYFTSIDDLPGEGVVAMKFLKR